MIGALLTSLLLLQAPDDSVARATALVEAGKLKDAQQVLDGADTSSTGAEYLRGLISYRLHDYVPASKLLQQALPAIPTGSPKYRETVRMIGQSEYLSGHIAVAIPWLEKAQASGSHSNELFYMLGNSYLQTRQIEKGRAAVAATFGVPPDSGAARLFTAQMLIRLELEDDAEHELAAALAREPNLPGLHFMLGEIAIYRAQTPRAIEELSREIALNPDFAMAYYRLGDAYTRQEDWDHAVPPLERAVWLNPTYSGPYILLGKAYFNKSDLANAEHMLRRALQMDPRNASAHYLLGRTLIKAGRTEEGKKLLVRWEELRKESGEK